MISRDMSRLTKRNILVAIISVTSILLIFTLHFHGKSSDQSSDTYSKPLALLNSQLNLRRKDSVSAPVEMIQVSRDIGEFGSPSPSTSSPMMDSTSNSIINQDINNYTASIDSNSLTANSSLFHKNDEQFAFDNLQNDHSSSIDHPVVQKYVTEDAANLTLSSDVFPRADANISKPTMPALTIVPTIVPTMLPTTTVVPTIGLS